MGLFKDDPAYPLAAEIVVRNDPEEVEASLRSCDGSVTGIGDRFPADLCEKKKVVAPVSMFKLLKDKFNSDWYFKIIKKTGGDDHLPDDLFVARLHITAKNQILGTHIFCVNLLHPPGYV
jgi:hypothetical protein